MLSRLYRFHGLGSLNYAYKQGQTVRGQLLGLKYVPNSRRKTYRVAVVVSRKVSKSAVVRNRIRRRVYEAFQDYQAQVNGPYDLVFTAFNEQLATVEFEEVKRQVGSLLQKANVLNLEAGGPRDIVSTEGETQ
jgi:ribonuclease P protein component